MDSVRTAQFVATYTSDVCKKRKKWLDGELDVYADGRSELYSHSSDGKRSAQPIARVARLPDDVCPRSGGGDAFVMRGGGDRGREFLVQVDEAGAVGKGMTSGNSGAFVMPQVALPRVATGSGFGMQKQAQTQGRGPSGDERDDRERQQAGEDRKRRKRSTQEILDMLGIEVKGYRERSENADANVGERGRPAAPQQQHQQQRDLAPAPRRPLPRQHNQHQGNTNTNNTTSNANTKTDSSAWTSKAVDKVINPAIMRGKGGGLSAGVPPSSSVSTLRMNHALPQVNAPAPRSQMQAFDGSTLVCPTPQASTKAVRTVRIPTSFGTTWEYLNTMKKAVLEEAYLRIIDTTTSVFFGGSGGKGNNGNNGRRGRMPFDHGQCSLKIWRNQKSSDSEDKPESVYLILGAHTLKASEYHKSDVWLLSNEPGFGGGSVHKTSSSSTWTCVVRSLWHGPNKDGKFEVEFVSKKPPYLGKSTNVYALKGPDLSIEMDLSEMVLEGVMREGAAPIIPSLLSEVTGPDSFLPSVDELARDMPAFNEVADRFGLNEYQRKALSSVAAWHVSSQSRPVCLVHGPFGTGKSQLMVSILHLILRLRDTSGGLSNARVMVSSHTNVAVDRVCLGLMESGVTDFLRVGALRKIDVELLGHSLHASESKAHASALNELKDMAKTAQGRLLAKLKLQIAEVERGADRQRKKRLKTCPIVGVTCVSTSLEVLQGQQFEVLLLDEASQLTEPLSLAPVIRSKCKYLIAAGDPNQLPPVVCSPDHVRGDRVHSLVRPLFVRLVGLGHVPHLLRTQYRCHPDISDVCNRHFYDNSLEDGLGPEQRPSLVPGMSHAVAVVDVQGQEQYKARSIYNDAEARAVSLLIRNLVQAGVAPGDIGVIAFYKAHADALKRSVGAVVSCGANGDNGDGGDGGDGEVQIATVDSFQGAEKRVIILSTATTKASPFVSEPTRLNVALSRAKNHLFLVGSQALLRSIPSLDYLLRRSQARGGYFIGGIKFG